MDSILPRALLIRIIHEPDAQDFGIVEQLMVEAEGFLVFGVERLVRGRHLRSTSLILDTNVAWKEGFWVMENIMEDEEQEQQWVSFEAQRKI